MINLSDKLIMLKDTEEIALDFVSNLKKVILGYEREYKVSDIRKTTHETTLAYFKNFTSTNIYPSSQDDFNLLVSTLFFKNPHGYPTADVLDFMSSAKTIPLNKSKRNRMQTEGVERIIKLTYFSMWAKGCWILPKSFTAIKLPCPHFQKIIEERELLFLERAISINPASGFNFKGGLSKGIGDKCKSHWQRLILNTDWTSTEKVTRESISELIENGSGSKHALLARYYVNDFLSFLFADDQTNLALYKKVLEEIINKRNRVKEEKLQAAAERKKERDKGRIRRRTRNGSREPTKTEIRIKECIAFSRGESDLQLSDMLSEHIVSHSLRKLFFSKNLDVPSHPIYQKVGERPQKLIELVDTCFKAFITSKGNQRTSDDEFCLSIFLSYLSVYLPSYFIEEEGSLENFPITFNEFQCPFYVVMNTHLTKLVTAKKNPPLSLFNYIELMGEKFGWNWEESAYPRLLVFRCFFDFVERYANTFPDTDKFRNTIADSDMPKTRKRVTTAKNVIPREYFKLYLSLLETFDYMVDHINGMADGINPGIVNDLLVYPTYEQLCESKTWAGLWGKEGSIKRFLDLELLNYTPVVHYEGKVIPIKKAMRFYWITPYKIKGKDCQRIAPHTSRVSLIMANTGIRQKHIIWLNKEEFDSAINSKRKSFLAPLLVSTDKSHSEWVSVVSHNVIELCQKQREFYDNCELESFKEDVPYGFYDKPKFGRFKPLFRLSTKGKDSWSIYDHFPKILWSLQHIIKTELHDTELDDLVHWKPSNKQKTPGKLDDHIMTDEQFNNSTVDLSWDWKIRSQYTPHGLRAAFVSDHIRVLPPHLIGRHLTGQSADLVWYYTILDAEGMPDQQELMLQLLMKNEEAIQNGQAPELASKINDLNVRLAKDIADDTDSAIRKHKLFSLAGVEADKNGLAVLRAKKYATLALNYTHICPFNNNCPTEVIKDYGSDRPCALCPYAIRGYEHLPAVSAEKRRTFELVSECEIKLKDFYSRKGVPKSEIEQLEKQFDRYSQDAAVLEAIEQQLEHLLEADNRSYVTGDSGSIKKLYQKLSLNEADHIFSRLIDVQNFPNLDSSEIQSQFALLRYKLLMQSGELAKILEKHNAPEHALLSSQIHSIMSTNQLTVGDIYKIASTAISVDTNNLPTIKQLENLNGE